MATDSDASGSRATFSPEETADALVDSANRFGDLVPAISDPGARTPYVANWTVDEIVRHVACGAALYTQIADQERALVATAGELGAFSDANIAAIKEVSLDECESRIRDGAKAFAERVRVSSPDDPPVPFWAGTQTNLLGLGGVLVGEYEMHGLDVAAALGRNWPVTRRHAAMAILAAAHAAAPAWVDETAAAGHSCSYEVRFRGGLGTLRMRFDDGVLTVNPPGAWRPQVIISADPAAFLRVFYRRQNQWSAIARGQMFAWGTKPWNAFGMADRFLPI